MKIEKWLERGLHLPDFLRDFHAQKNFFKSVDKMRQHHVAQSKADGRWAALEPMDWAMAHIFVIDVFLRYMALHGYTLQRSRKQGTPFEDIYQTMQEDAAERVALSSAVLKSGLSRESAS